MTYKTHMGEKTFYLTESKTKYCLNLLSKNYSKNEFSNMLPIVQAPFRIIYETGYDNWNGGTYQHDLIFSLPTDYMLEYDLKENSCKIKNKILTDLNKLIPDRENESFRDIDFEFSEDISSPVSAVSAEIEQLWDDLGHQKIRIFLSHISEYKVQIAKLKDKLAELGCSAFVAHEDIRPNSRWSEELLKALHSMDVFVAVCTENFFKSVWTSQEVGFAMCKCSEMQRLAVKLRRTGENPQGFLGEYQALSSEWDSMAYEIIAHFLKAGLKEAINAYIASLKDCNSFYSDNYMLINCLHDLTDSQKEALIDAHNNSILKYIAAAHNADFIPVWENLTGKKCLRVGNGYGEYGEWEIR